MPEYLAASCDGAPSYGAAASYFADQSTKPIRRGFGGLQQVSAGLRRALASRDGKFYFEEPFCSVPLASAADDGNRAVAKTICGSDREVAW